MKAAKKIPYEFTLLLIILQPSYIIITQKKFHFSHKNSLGKNPTYVLVSCSLQVILTRRKSVKCVSFAVGAECIAFCGMQILLPSADAGK